MSLIKLIRLWLELIYLLYMNVLVKGHRIIHYFLGLVWDYLNIEKKLNEKCQNLRSTIFGSSFGVG